jgi:mRNA interferase MazF
VPLTSNLRRLYPFQVLLPAKKTRLRQDSKAQAEQIRSITVERVGSQVGLVPATIMVQINEALRLHLDL